MKGCEIMLKKSLSDFNQNIFEAIGQDYMIVTAGDKTVGFNCLTASWGGFGVLWGKPVAYIFIRKSRYTYQFIDKSKQITLSFLDNRYQSAKKIIGTKSGRDIDKMAETGLHYTYDPDYNGAYIEECDFCFKTSKLYAVDMPYESLPEDIKERYYAQGNEHTMFVCEIKQYLVKES